MRHSFEAHSSSPNFSFACGIDGCPQTFKTFSAITSHLRRRHRGTELESAALAPTSSEDQHCQSYESLDMELTEVSQEETLLHASMSIQVDCLQRSAALFLLCLKERYEVTQTAVDFAVGQVQQMVAYTVEDIQSSVKNCLIPHLQAKGLPVDLLDIDECFGVPDLFCNLQTEYMQTKFYRENFNLVVSRILFLDLEVCMPLVFTCMCIYIYTGTGHY